MVTTFSDIETLFHSMPLTKFEIPEALEAEWLKIAIADYELNLGYDLKYDPIRAVPIKIRNNQLWKTSQRYPKEKQYGRKEG